MFRSALAVLLLLLTVNLFVLAQDPGGAEVWDKSICLPKGGWNCQEQGIRLCNWNRPECGGSCVVCRGALDVPPKMCFMDETEKCTPTTEYICAYSYSKNATCVMQNGVCTCDAGIVTGSDGPCNFRSCN